MKPKSDVKILHKVIFEEFAWAESNDRKHRDDDTVKGFCEDFRDCTNVAFHSQVGLGGSDYSFSSNGCVGRIAINCDTTGDEYVRYVIDNVNIGTTDFEMLEARIKVTSASATIRIWGIFTTAGSTQIYSGSPLSWTTVRSNLYDLVGSDTLESIRIELDDTDVFDGGWLYGFIDWIRVYKLRKWACGVTNKKGKYWNNDGVLRIEGTTTGSDWLELVRSITFNTQEYPYIVYRARAINGGKYRVAFSTSIYSEHTNTDWEIHVTHVDDFTGSVPNNPTNFYVASSDNGQNNGGTEIDWVVICRDPLEVSKNGHLIEVDTRREDMRIGTFDISLVNPQVKQDSLFYDNFEWTAIEDPEYNEQTYRNAGWQCRGGHAAHWDLESGSGSDASDGDKMTFSVTTGPCEWSHSPGLFISSAFFKKCKVRMKVSNSSASLSLRFKTTDGSWYESSAWDNDTNWLVRVIDLNALCNGKVIEEIHVKVAGDSYDGLIDFIKMYREVELGLYSQSIASKDVIVVSLSRDGVTYGQCVVGYVGNTEENETHRQINITGHARAFNYSRILENEIYFEKEVDEVYKDIIDELGGYIRPDRVTYTPIYLWFHEIRGISYWETLQRLCEMGRYYLDISDSGGLSFDFKYPRLIEDYFEVDDPPRPVMWREWSTVGVSGGAAKTDWSIVDGHTVSTADSYLFHDKWITDDFEIVVTWKRNASDVGSDKIYFCYHDHQNHYYAKLDFASDTVGIQKVVNGTDTQVTSEAFTLASATEYKITIKAEAGVLSIFVDDALMDVAAETTFDAGRVGFYTNQIVSIDTFKMKSIGYTHILKDYKDVTTSSYRTGFEDIVNHLWVWGRVSATSRAVFAEYSDQASIDTHGIREDLLVDSGTINAGTLKTKATHVIEDSKSPSIDIGIAIMGDPSVKVGDVIFFDSEYLASRKKYFVQGVKNVFSMGGYFTELMLVKV